ncbi:MAG: hypothetical protein V7731_06795 [Amphritea sp.]
MKFLALMLVLLLGRYRRRPGWATNLSCRAFAGESGVFQWGIIFLFLIIIEFILLQFDYREYGLAILLVELAVLFIYLPHWNVYDLTGVYAKLWSGGDSEGAYLDAADALQLDRRDAAQDARSDHYSVCKGVIYKGFLTFFLLLFWFVCLGVPGVFLAILIAQKFGEKQVKQSLLLKLLFWLPCRILGYTFFIVGNGLGAYEQLNAHGNRETSNERWLFHMALGAIGEDSHRQYSNPRVMTDAEFRMHAADELRNITALIRRSAVLWLVVFGVLTMLGIESPLL